MKRLLAMLLAGAVLAALLCGCASGETQETKGTEAADEGNVTEAKKPETAAGAPQAIVESLVGNSLDLSIYEMEKDEDSLFYYNSDQYGSFPYEITISGITLHLNGVTTYQDVLDAGWNANMPETADANYSYIGPLAGPEDRHFTITLDNVNDEAIAMGETYLLAVTGSIKYCGSFTYGGLTENSTVSDVIKAIGTPYSVYCSEISGLTLKFKDNCDHENSLSFTFGQDGVITEISLHYNHYNLS